MDISQNVKKHSKTIFWAVATLIFGFFAFFLLINVMVGTRTPLLDLVGFIASIVSFAFFALSLIKLFKGSVLWGMVLATIIGIIIFLIFLSIG